MVKNELRENRKTETNYVSFGTGTQDVYFLRNWALVFLKKQDRLFVLQMAKNRVSFLVTERLIIVNENVGNCD